MKSEQQDYVDRQTRRVVGKHALKKMRGLVDDFSTDDEVNRRFVKIFLSVFLLILVIVGLYGYFVLA